VHVLVKGLDAEAVAWLAEEVEPGVTRLGAMWRGYRGAGGAWRVEIAPLQSAMQAIGYVALHHHKVDQRPPEGWTGRRFGTSISVWNRATGELVRPGYFAGGSLPMREQARHELHLRGVMRRVRVECAVDELVEQRQVDGRELRDRFQAACAIAAAEPPPEVVAVHAWRYDGAGDVVRLDRKGHVTVEHDRNGDQVGELAARHELAAPSLTHGRQTAAGDADAVSWLSRPDAQPVRSDGEAHRLRRDSPAAPGCLRARRARPHAVDDLGARPQPASDAAAPRAAPVAAAGAAGGRPAGESPATGLTAGV
jgi:hypothetical protein